MKLHIRKLEEIKTTSPPGHTIFGKDFGMAVKAWPNKTELVWHVIPER
jgi:hypothetical protein